MTSSSMLSFESVIVKPVTNEILEEFAEYVWRACRDPNGNERLRLLKEMEDASPLELTTWLSFKLCCETVTSLAECFRYDALRLRSVVRSASTMCLSIDGSKIRSQSSHYNFKPKVNCMLGIVPLHIWNNIPLWIDLTDAAVCKDFATVDTIFSNTSIKASLLFYGWSRPQVKLIFICNRIAAVQKTMRSFGLKNDIIEVYMATVQSRYKLSDFNIRVSDFILNSWVSEVLSAAIVALSKFSPEQNFPTELSLNGSIISFGYGDCRETYDIGYSTILSMLLIPAFVHLYTNGSMGASDSTLPMASSAPRSNCFCGNSLLPWSIVGTPPNEEMLLQSKLMLINMAIQPPPIPNLIISRLSNCICESCYRNCCLNLYGDDDTTLGMEMNSSEICPISISPCLVTEPLVSKVEFTQRLSSIACTDFEKSVHRALRVPLTPAKQSPSKKIDSEEPVANKGNALIDRISGITSDGIAACDDASVISAYSKLGVDDVSVAKSNAPKGRGEVVPMPISEFNDFFHDLWNGITITLIYSHNPPVEKMRLLYIRSDGRSFNELLLSACSLGEHSSTTVSDVAKRNNIPLYLGWARQSEKGHIVWNPKKCVAMNTIQNIKVGSKKWSNCIKLATDKKIIVIKMEEDEEFQRCLRGLTQLLGSMS